MRTTIEISNEHRDRLMEVAARNGERGVSALVAEALRRYLPVRARTVLSQDEALGLRGSLSTEEANALRRAIRDLRSAG